MTGTFHIVIAMKPIEGTFAENALKHGVAGLSIDACRVATNESLNGGAYAKNGKERHDGDESWRYKREGGAGEFIQPTGRFPANIIHDASAEVLAGFPEAKGQHRQRRNLEHIGIFGVATRQVDDAYSDSGSAARFFHAVEEYEIESEKQ